MQPDHPLCTADSTERDRLVRPFVIRLAIVCVVVSLLPFLVAWAAQSPGVRYLGSPLNTDDHMVYAAWMRQAMEGRFFFDNRFTTDEQPGLSIHLYFWVLGHLANLTGIVLASTLARAVFTFAFVFCVWALLRRTSLNVFVTKLALAVTCFGGGLGFLVWHDFGTAIVKPTTQAFAPLFGRVLPVDVWQPEVFVFPSMLSNGLFMVSLCLMIVIIIAVLDARESWRPVWWGAPAFGVLMNIHSYDVLILALALLGLLVASVRHGFFSWSWLVRVLVMSAGILPAAGWFLHVLAQDKVFQARAATPTFSPVVPALLGGLALAIVLVCVFLWHNSDEKTGGKRATYAAASMFVVMGVLGYQATSGAVLSPAGWAIGAGLGLLTVVFASSKDAALSLLLSWAMIGFSAPYFPALFQRKMAAGLMIPFAILAAIGLAEFMRRFERQQRNGIAAVFLVLLAASSVLWLRRDLMLIRENVSSTTMHPVFLNRDSSAIVDYLNANRTDRTVVVAIPGVSNPSERPDEFSTPMIPDLNPILSGLAGVYTYAGHWSETPNYGEKRDRSLRELFLDSSTPAERAGFLAEIKPDYIVTIQNNNFPDSPFENLAEYGEVVYAGNQFLLIKVR